MLHSHLRRVESERRIGIGISILSFCLYFWTLCPSVFPGASAIAVASVLRMLPMNAMIGHPLWNMSARMFMLIPIGEIPYRLNLFSALCGAGAIYLLFRMVTCILHETMREGHWVQQMDVEDGSGSCSESRSEQHIPKGEHACLDDVVHRIAMAGAAVSAFAFAFCMPFWSAATSLHVQTFDLLLFFMAGYAIARYVVKASLLYFLLATFLLGLGMVESVTFVISFPVALGFLLYAGHRHGQLSDFFTILLFVCIGTGILIAIAAFLFWIQPGELSTRILDRAIAIWNHQHLAALASAFPRKGWMLIVIQGLLPVLTLYLGARSFIHESFSRYSVTLRRSHGIGYFVRMRNHFSLSSWFCVNIIFLALAAMTLLNLPGSPWTLSRESGYLPIMPLLGMAMTCGWLFVYGILLGRKPGPEESEHHEVSDWFFRFGGILFASLIVVMVIGTAFRNFREADGRCGAFVDTLCRDILADAPQATCFVTDGLFDVNLLVCARIQKRKISLFDVRQANVGGRSTARPFGETRQTGLDFIREWLRRNTQESYQVALLTAPRLWCDAGFQAIPEGLVYLGCKRQETLELNALLIRNRRCWKRIEQMFEVAIPCSGLLERFHSRMRMHASRMANDFGVLCLHNKSMEAAKEAFQHVQIIDPCNLCAFLNDYMLSSADREKNGQDESIRGRLTSFMERHAKFDAISDYETYYGALYQPSLEHLVNDYISGEMSRSPSQETPPILTRLIEYCRELIYARPTLHHMPGSGTNGAPADAALASAVHAMMQGYWSSAETQLRALIQKRRTLLSAWSLLAEVLMNLDRFDEVDNTILPAMRAVVGSKDVELIDMTEGCFALRKKPSDFSSAHACFTRVLQRNPDMEEAQNQLIQSSMAVGDVTRVEADCTHVIAHTPMQPKANAVLGSIRLSQGRLEAAETALKISIASRPSASALNDLGETLRQMKRLEPAEAASRRALLLNASFYQAWDTLGQILGDAGKLEDAVRAQYSALRLCQTDIRLFLNTAKLEKKRNNHGAVRTLLNEAAPLLKTSSALQKADYAELLKNSSTR